MNTFELSMDDGASERLNHAFLDSRKDQCMLYYFLNTQLITKFFKDKQVFPSLELMGWYTVTQEPTLRHIALHEQVRTSPPLVHEHKFMSTFQVRSVYKQSHSLNPSTKRGTSKG